MALSVEQKIALLNAHDFHLVARDPLVKSGHPGAWMIKDLLDNSPEQWAVTGDDVQVLCDAAIDAHELTQYMVGEWDHFFHEGLPATHCRFVLDRVTKTVCCAQSRVNNTWKTLGRDDRADLLESVNDNEVWSSRDMQEGFEKTNELPDWSLS